MRIRARLQLNTMIIAIVAFATGIVLIGFDLQRERLRGSLEELQSKVTHSTFQLNNLTLEYIRSPSKRVMTQWSSFNENLALHLSAIQAETKDEQVAAAALMDDIRIVKSLFSRLTALEGTKIDGEIRGNGGIIMAGQLLLKTQAIITGALELENIRNNRLIATRRMESFLIVAMMAGLVVVIGGVGLHLNRSISHPLDQLMVGTRALGAGQLKHRIQLDSADEFGELAAAFDSMAVQIQANHTELERRVQQRTVALDAAVKELETFSYSVSHDLRSPLRAIDGFSRVLLEEYTDKLDAEGQRLLNVVRDSAMKMSRLIDDILSFSRTSRAELKLTPVDMEAMVNAVLSGTLSAAREGRNIAFQTGTLPPALGDRAMLERVWTNLLDNAIKFTSAKPDARIEIGTTAGQGETVYYVRDNGVGFDMQYVGKLFGVFQRLHGAEVPGTGIGLAVVERIVARHGGRVWAEGKVGEGATFYFTIPAEETKHG